MTQTGGYWIDATTDSRDVLDALRSSGAERPQMWTIMLENDDFGDWGDGPAVYLAVGLFGDLGIVRWTDRSGTFLPDPNTPTAIRTDEPVRYFDAHGVQGGNDIRLHFEADTVYAAVAEALRTRQRPTLFAWNKETPSS